MDFYRIKERPTKSGIIEIYPDFKVCRSKDLMIRGMSFYSVWYEKLNMWSTDEYHIQQIVDLELDAYKNELSKKTDAKLVVKYMSNFSSNTWAEFRRYMKHMSDHSHQLDNKITFANDKVERKDYRSKRLDYDLKEGNHDAWDEIIGTLYNEEDRAKLEWAIGSIIAGDSKSIQKFIVLFGAPGTGKGTILEIIQKLFKGYYSAFDAKALGSNNNTFATDVFKTNPLVAIQHDGDLSKIEDNTKLNSIVSHEEMTLSEKYKPSYTAKINAFLFMGTNKPVKISDAKSGIIRRLIDVSPSGNKIPPKHYHTLISQIDFELGAIAHHCLEIYQSMGKNYYAGYKPTGMMYQTDVFFNYIEANYFIFKEQDGVSLKQAFEMYKIYCDEALIPYKLAKYKFREELKNYFLEFHDVTRIDNKQVRNYYQGFITDKLTSIKEDNEPEHAYSLVLDSVKSLFDEEYSECIAQYASNIETPKRKWEEITTKLSSIDTSKIHYVKVPENHIIIDFDLKDEEGNKSLEKNLEAASKWPATYAELSKGERGIHLHYNYDGDTNKLSRIYDDEIEIKVSVGNSSLRRKLTKCNNVPVATINSGLPLRGEKMINFEGVKNEKALRTLIEKNLRKEIHPGTKPSVDFIHKILEDAYNSGMTYDVSDLAQHVLIFASNSSHQGAYCINKLSDMKFKSEQPSLDTNEYDSDEIVFFDVEVFPNLFVIVWKYRGKDKKIRMINPTAKEVEPLLKMMLVGFNCRRYDNHILYARYIGYTLEQLYRLSKRIIENEKNALFAEAYNISYTDIYEFSSKKQSLKKFEIELGIHHQELGLSWDEPVPENKWNEVAEYCENDVDATEATFDAREADFTARKILADLSGLSVNDTTQRHAAKIIFGNDKEPQKKFIYTDLSEEFPGYEFKLGKSTYRGEKVSEGGQVFSKPGMYGNVGLFDIASQHPNSLRILNHFGPYTPRFVELVNARVAIKHGDFEKARGMLDGILVKYLIGAEDNSEIAEALSYALKIVINIVYGMTSAKFNNPFKDPRNKDNIVAKRGALFMVDLRHAVEEQGYNVIHIKTDSIKVEDTDDFIAQFIMDFGKKYGYDFEHEATYDKMCLVNDAVYVAKYGWSMKEKNIGKWSATGAQFAKPYVFKTLFSNEPILFEDMCETKSVKSSMYLDMNEELWTDEFSALEKELKKLESKVTKAYYTPVGDKDYMSEADLETSMYHIDNITKILNDKHDYHFVGKVGSFCPVKPNRNGGLLMREADGKYHAVTGTKGYRWLEAEVVKELNKQDDIEREYYNSLVDDAIKNISQYGDFEWFTSEDPYDPEHNGIMPF